MGNREYIFHGFESSVNCSESDPAWKITLDYSCRSKKKTPRRREITPFHPQVRFVPYLPLLVLPWYSRWQRAVPNAGRGDDTQDRGGLQPLPGVPPPSDDQQVHHALLTGVVDEIFTCSLVFAGLVFYNAFILYARFYNDVVCMPGFIMLLCICLVL